MLISVIAYFSTSILSLRYCLKFFHRVDLATSFNWQSNGELVQLDFLSWSGGVGSGDCLVIYYTNERVGAHWTTVAIVEEASCSGTYAVICEHKSKYILIRITALRIKFRLVFRELCKSS